MNDVKTFLQQNLTECLLMRIKEERTPLPGSEFFSQIWAAYMQKFGELFAPIIVNNGPLPTIGTLRGTVLVLRQASFSGVGVNYSGLLTDIQDEHKVFLSLSSSPFGPDTVSLEQKREFVKLQIRKALSSSKIVLNHTSGGTGMLPEAVARNTHPVVYNEIGPYKGPKRTGVVIMDYPGERLVYQIVKSNMVSSVSCKSSIWRGQSDRTFAEFRLPRAAGGTIITFWKGFYGIFVFPKCHRVTWSDLRFSCEAPSGKWKLQGRIDVDGFCFSSKTNQPYLVVGNY